MRFPLALIAALLPVAAPGWALHYLVTDRSLPSETVSEPMTAEPLEGFLTAQRGAVSALFADYYRWLEKRGSKRFRPMSFDPRTPTVAAFLRAARLNPNTRLLLVNRMLPGEKPRYPTIPFSAISIHEKAEEGFSYVFEDVSGKPVTGREVLRTFSDEPDWGLDNDLWGIAEYGYGTLPYGRPEGSENKGPFHAQFVRENWLMRWLAPEVVEGGMVVDRLELMRALSRLAFRSGHRYWGYRFAAWAFHYAQDISQPYHAKAVPFAGLGFYLRFAVSGDRAKFKRDQTTLVINRHYLYEDFVQAILQRSYLEPKDPSSARIVARIVAALGDTSAALPFADTALFFDGIAGASAGRAFAVDAGIARAFGAKRTGDPEYHLTKDPAFRPGSTLDDAGSEMAETLVAETIACLRQTGAATRAVLTTVTTP